MTGEYCELVLYRANTCASCGAEFNFLAVSKFAELGGEVTEFAQRMVDSDLVPICFLLLSLFHLRTQLF